MQSNCPGVMFLSILLSILLSDQVMDAIVNLQLESSILDIGMGNGFLRDLEVNQVIYCI